MSTAVREKQTAVPTPVKEKATASVPLWSGSLLQDFPFSLSRMQEEFNRLFDRWQWAWPLQEAGQANGWKWDVNMIDQNGTYVVRAEAPGFEPGDFDVQLEGNRLILKAAQKAEKGKKGEAQEWQEREYYYAMTLPGCVDREKAGAVYKNGVLSIILPKTEEAKGKKLVVKTS